MSETELADATRDLESVAALGYLLNAIAHDLNNQLTNLLLGADQIQYGGGADAVEMMVQQAGKVAEITRAVQRLGQSNLGRGAGPSDLGAVARSFAAWRAMTGRSGDVLEVTDGLMTRADPTHLQRALVLLADAFTDAGGPVKVTVGLEDMPRTVWSKEGDTTPMAVLRLRVGDPDSAEWPRFKAVVDAFFDGDRTDSDVRLMAAWEIVRKQRGRMSVHGSGESGGREVVLSFAPVA